MNNYNIQKTKTRASILGFKIISSVVILNSSCVRSFVRSFVHSSPYLKKHISKVKLKLLSIINSSYFCHLNEIYDCNTYLIETIITHLEILNMF